jgi:hypothetical protein
MEARMLKDKSVAVGHAPPPETKKRLKAKS